MLATMPLASLYAFAHQPGVLYRIIGQFRNVARTEDPAIVLENAPSESATTSKRPNLMPRWSPTLPHWALMKAAVMNSAFHWLKR